jgi:predicted RNA-binding protein with PUA-like domain
MAEKQHWLMKSEPEEFSIDDLARVRVEPWSGVRNYMARAHMRRMQVGDEVLFHHSSVDPPGVAGLARVVRTGVLDEKQFDRRSPYHDPKATREKPIWDCVDVEYVATFPCFVSMDRLRAEPACGGMLVLKRGMRLSVQPVTPDEYAAVVALGHTPPVAGAAGVAGGAEEGAGAAAGEEVGVAGVGAKRVRARREKVKAERVQARAPKRALKPKAGKPKAGKPKAGKPKAGKPTLMSSG